MSATPPEQARPALVYVMGGSGVGKDAVMAFARARVSPTRFAFAHRYITRPASPGEAHVPLTEAEFAARREAGLFAMWWESHGLSYAIGEEALLWLRQGLTVVMNGSRGAWPELSRRSDLPLVPVMIVANAETRHARLMARGREPAAAVASRLAREPAVDLDGMVVIENDGEIESAGLALVAVLHRLAGRP